MILNEGDAPENKDDYSEPYLSLLDRSYPPNPIARKGCCSARMVFFSGYFILLAVIILLTLFIFGFAFDFWFWVIVALSPVLAFVPMIFFMYFLFVLGLMMMVFLNAQNARNRKIYEKFVAQQKGDVSQE